MAKVYTMKNERIQELRHYLDSAKTNLLDAYKIIDEHEDIANSKRIAKVLNEVKDILEHRIPLVPKP